MIDNPDLNYSIDLFCKSLDFTAREREIFITMISKTTNTEEIAGALCVSHHTVRNHLKTMLQKANASSRTELLAQFIIYDGRLKRERGSDAQSVPPPSRPFRLLFADDDKAYRVFVEEILERNKIQANTAFVTNGAEALKILRTSIEDSTLENDLRPDLMILDLNMPRKDGREVMEEVRQDPRLRQIPIVVLTTSISEADKFLTYDLGAASFINKPKLFKELEQILVNLIKYWEMAGRASFSYTVKASDQPAG